MTIRTAYSLPATSRPVPRDIFGLNRASRSLYYLATLVIGVLVLRPALGLTASDWLFFTCLVATIAYQVLQPSRIQLPLPKLLAAGVALFTIGGLISSIHALHPAQSASIVLRFVYLTIIWFWVGPLVLRTGLHLRTALSLWTSSAAIASLGAVGQLLRGNIIPGTSVSWGRMTGLTQHVNDLGGLTAIALIPALMMATRPRISLPNRLAAILVLAAVATGLVLSGSVTGFVAAGFGLLLWLAISGGRRQAIAALGIVALTITVVVIAQVTSHARSPLDRLTQVTANNGSQGATLATRITLDERAIQVVAQNPVIGVGLDAADANDRIGNLVHNMLLGAWMGAGILGFIGVLLALGGAVIMGISSKGAAVDQDDRFLASGLLVATIVFIVFGMAAPLLYQRYAWMPVALLIVLRSQQLPSHTATAAPS